jgi:hypothetical protein
MEELHVPHPPLSHLVFALCLLCKVVAMVDVLAGVITVDFLLLSAPVPFSLVWLQSVGRSLWPL